MRTAYDLYSLYPSMIGVDHMASLIETALKGDLEGNYPPYDIEKVAEDAYRITLAAAGFRPDDLDITAQPNLLIVTGRKAKASDDRVYLHRGIGQRDFVRRFELADYVVVKSAGFADGVLSIDLAREAPEAVKPRRVEIDLGGGRQGRLESGQSPRRAA